jgi:PKD repeat protein
MRKLYALLAGICFALTATHAQTPTADVANFTFSVNASGNVVFTNTSTIGDAPGPRHAVWSFGDGTSQTTGPLEGTQHQYTAAGSYTVCLKILRYASNTNEPVVTAQICKTIVIESVCRADFERLPIATSNNPLNVIFKALPWHSNGNKPVYICWKFGDGRDTCIQYSNTFPGPYTVNHTYANPGEYEVCVKIVYQGGCEARKCKEIRVIRPDSCKADFERLPVTTSNNVLTASFKALPWHSSNKKPATVCWKFGDGRDTCINYGQDYTGNYTVNHTYQEPGQYEVCVKILYHGGCEARKCKPVQIGRPDSCAANFERLPVTSANHPLTTIFKALPYHNNNKKPKTICWTFGDGRDTCINYLNIYNGTYTVAHTYNQPGNYQVCVKILYYGGCEASKCKPIEVVRPDECRADFERVPFTSSNNQLTTYFKALPWSNNNKKPAKICWTFGDGRDTCINYGQDYTGPYAVSHTYNQPGNYEVCVKILYYGGCEARKCKVIEVTRPDQCRADFERIPLTSANHPLLTYFKALPSHNNNKKPAKICWTFGDGRDTCINYGQDYTGQYGVGHLYNQPGNYEVCVRIFYYGGCEAKKCELVRVPEQSCKVEVHELATSATGLQRVFYAAVASTPTRPVQRICWSFGDGEDTCINATATDPADLFIRHTYPGPGVYRACVKVLFEGGCETYDCEEVVIRSNTDICGGYMTDSLVAPRTFKFKGFAIHRPNDEVLYYKWTFGDGTSAVGREVTHTYNVPGEYRVCLTIVTRSGCETKICNTVKVPGNNTPRLLITPNPVVNTIHALFYSTHTETVTIKVVNSNGVVVRSITRNAVTGANNWDFDAYSLLPGYYTFIVQSPNQLVSAMFLKL